MYDTVLIRYDAMFIVSCCVTSVTVVLASNVHYYTIYLLLLHDSIVTSFVLSVHEMYRRRFEERGEWTCFRSRTKKRQAVKKNACWPTIKSYTHTHILLVRRTYLVPSVYGSTVSSKYVHGGERDGKNREQKLYYVLACISIQIIWVVVGGVVVVTSFLCIVI